MKNSLILYPINYESAPNYVIRRAFQKHFPIFDEYDWWNISNKKGLLQTQRDFLAILQAKRPEYCFMQLQGVENMSVEMIREMAKYTKIINWSGDVRDNNEWYDWFINIGKEIHLTLFTNMHDVYVLRDHHVRADYLQVGFDDVWYDRQAKLPGKHPEIVFCANASGTYPLSQYRKEVAFSLREEFKDRFQLYGLGWEKHGLTDISYLRNQEEAYVYNQAKIGISVSHFSLARYHSDRLLRIMGSGAATISHYFSGIEEEFEIGTDLFYFSNIPELIDLCRYLLSIDYVRLRIANAGYKKAHEECTWDVRCKQLIELLNKYK